MKEFKYLGTLITEDLNPEIEIKRRIGYAKATFGRMKNFLTNRFINLKSRKRMLKRYVYSVLLYSFETITFSAQAIKRLEACEMWFYRRMLRIPWVQKITNIEVLRRAKTEWTMIEIIKKRKMVILTSLLQTRKRRERAEKEERRGGERETEKE